jgi:nucleotide-binding universal stress UspA family protein
MNLLLAIDDSYYSELAVREVASRRSYEGGTIKVLSVAHFLGTAVPGIPNAGEPAATSALFEARTQLLEGTNALVQRAAEQLSRDGVRVETLVREGDPGTEIIQEAESWPADLIVVASHGHRGLKRLLLGSTAQYVTNHAPCSVEIVRARGNSESS